MQNLIPLDLHYRFTLHSKVLVLFRTDALCDFY